MKQFLDKIGYMNSEELQEIMKAVEQRFSVIHPEWDVLYIALHKDSELRRREVENILQFMRNRNIAR